MKELSKKKYVTLITIMILVLGIIGIVNIENVDLDKGKVKLKSASIEKLKSSVIESKGYEEITYPVLYELEKVEGIEERNVIIKGTLTKEENKYARFKEITSKTITSTVSENGREIEIKIEKVKLGRQNKINIKIEINGAINETKIKPEIEIKEESEKEYTKVNTEEIEVKTNSVTGLVQDEEGMSVSNLELSINKGNEEIRRTYTDENGRYVFSDVEEGKYIIKVEEENYELKEIKEVEVIGGITENIIVKKIKPYEIEVNKYISKIKLNNNGKEIEYEYGKLNKVNQTVKNLKNLSGEIEYKIEIKNTGEKSGEITKIEEEVTEGLKFSKEKNSEWEEKNGKIINRSLEGIKLKAGEEKEITLKLDIEKTDEARSYLQKVTAKGEVYQNVVYILDGKEYRKEKVLDGETIEEPKIVQENFKGWYTDKKYTNKYNFKNSVTKDIILYGKVEESTKKYTVQYIDEGKIIKEEELEEGSIISAPEVTKEGYTFDGWYEGEEKYDVYEPITRNLILESKYEINKYKVRFINEDGSVLQEETLDYGSTPTYKKETPTKKRTEEYTYEFDKWMPEITKVTSNQEYKATYKATKNKYTVTYINEGVEYHKETALYGSVVTEIQDPTKEGYTFKGWYTKDNEKVSYPITVTKNITLYSKYEVNSYKVSYYNEGKKYIEDQKINYGENALKPNTDPSKIGYTFKYWSLKENGEEYEFSTKITKDIDLYAVYEINKYTVTYINEGIEYHKETAEYGSVVTSIQDPTKEGYTFIGWYNENNEKVIHPITVTEDITLHSKYEINTYTVSFYHNNEKYVEDQKVNYGESAVKPSTDPTKEDYNFSGWVIKGTNNKYDFTSKVTKNIELESSFTVKPTYTVTYKIGNEVILTENVIEGHKVTSKEAPYKKGYLFDKWYSDEGLTIENNFDEKIMNNKTIYGKYNENKHTVTYINEGTTYYTEEVLDSFTAKGPNTNPSKIGYTFKYFSKDKKVAFDYNSEITEDITLYAVYEINKYTVTYINEGSEYHKEELTYGSKHEKIEDPFKTGYTFIGWYNENEEKVEYPITVTKDITLHSKYEINKYTVTFNDEDRITTKEVNYNAKVEPVTNQGKTGYTFKYWSIEKGGEEYNFNTLVTENITLYAVYEINTYKVTFKNYDGSTLQEETLGYGTLPKYKGEAPTREKTKEYTYTFKGWDKEITEVTNNQEYIATYTETKNKYNVKFTNYDGSILQEETLEYGTIPVYKGDVPTREKTEEYTYTFKDWNKEITEVTDNEIYIAVYKEEKNKYTVIYMDGEREYTRKEVNYGETVSEEVISKDHNIYRGWTLDENIYDFNTPVTKNITIKSSFELVESPIIENTPIEWTKENVKVTITTNHNDYSYMYKIDDGEYQNYNGEFTVDKNCTVIAKSIKENVESEVTTKEITNIDKVLPEIKEITEENITTKSFDIKVKGQDNESGLSEIRIYKNEELMVSYPYTERLNEEKEETYSLTGLEENTTYKIKVELIDKVGNVNASEEKEITTLKRIIVSRIIGRNNSLYESEEEYELFESLEEAVTSCGSNECTIEMVLDTKESVNVLEGQEIKLELNGKTVTGVRDYTIENSGELIIVDKEESEGGIINNTDTAIKNIGNGILQIGENEEPLSVSMTIPNIVGTTYGIYTEEETSKLKFYDGKIEGNVAIQGNVDDTPYLYNAKITNEGHQVATLSILAEAEAKITGGKYYTKLSNAVSETKSGTYEESNKSILSTAKSTTQYTFDYDEENDELISNNQKQYNQSAYAYIKLDLTDYNIDQELAVTGILSTRSNYGYVIVTNSKTAPAYNQSDGRVLFMTGDNETKKETGRIVLEKGKIYYLHIGYNKSTGWNDYTNNTDTFKITNITLSDYIMSSMLDEETNVVTQGSYGFTYSDGVLKSNNQKQRYTTANSYIKVDLTNYNYDRKIYIDAELHATAGDYGLITINNSEDIPSYNDTNGRIFYNYSEVSSKVYTANLEAGKVYYIHLGYKKNNGYDDSVDAFIINSITYNNGEPKNPTSKVPVLNEKVDTVELIKDITLTSPIEINETKEMILDLNGYTLTTSSNDYVIKNNGNLTIIDGKYQKDIEKNQRDYEAEQAKYDEEYNQELDFKNTKDKEYEKNLDEYYKKLEEYNKLHPNKDFEYTGEEEVYVVPKTGTYKLETWGAQGGDIIDPYHGGYGGYSSGYITLNEGDKLYINVGGKGYSSKTTSSYVKTQGGYNGGGFGYQTTDLYAAGGGGATHIATKSGLLSTLSDSLDSILIVSSGGAGAYGYSFYFWNGNSGGGIVGGYSNDISSAGTQTKGFAFGQAGDSETTSNWGSSTNRSGGGSGLYGGQSYWGETGSGGGSGYIGNSSLTNKAMYCYNCEESNDESTKTVSTTNVSSNAITNSAKIGNGYAKITLVNENETDFDYTGTEETYTVPEDGTYKLETWGAQGGSYNETYHGGYGSYSSGYMTFKKGDKLYINVGSQGKLSSTSEYNGGGSAAPSESGVVSYSGGGATHISTKSGLLSTLSSNLDTILVVSGGGGGTSYQNGPYTGIGGSGGGYVGSNGTNTGSNWLYGQGGNQTSGGADGGGELVNNEKRGNSGVFGQGGNGIHYSGGGGGGYYGGGASNQAGAGGGSGYIGNSNLTNKAMYCYNCEESSDESTKTISTTNVSEIPIDNYAKKGNGYAKITRIGDTTSIVTKPEKPLEPVNGYTTDDYVKDNIKLQLDGIDNTNQSKWSNLGDSGNNGTINGATNQDTGYYFDGNNDYVSFKQMNYDNLTVEATITPQISDSIERDIIVNYESGGYGLHIKNGYIYVCIYIDGSYRVIQSLDKYEIGKTYVVQATYDGKEMKLYVNNKLQNAISIIGTIGVPGNNTILMLGSNPRGTSADGNYFKGTIHSARIYDRTLNSDELYKNYNSDEKRFIGIIRKEATLKEATLTGTITSTTNSLIYNNLNANLTVKEAILNLNKSGSAIVNDGTVSTLSNVSINLNASGNGIYNGYYANIKDGGATINASAGSYGIYNLSKIDDGFSDYVFNLKYDSYHPSYGIYSTGKEINVKNITVNDGILYTAQDSKINFENSTIKSRIFSYNHEIIKINNSKINVYTNIVIGSYAELMFNNSIIMGPVYIGYNEDTKLKLENSELNGSINAYSGEIYLQNSMVNGSIYGGINSSNKVIIDNSNVTASGNSRDNYMINISDVVIKGKSVLTSTGFSSIYANSVIIGEKDGNINSEYPKIDNKSSSGDCIGILSKNLKIYDGTITTSKNNSIKSGISDIEDGYEIDITDSVDDKNNNFETVSLVKPTEAVAQIGEKTYTTLSSAINDVKNGETIQIIKNIFPVREFSISEDKNFSLDLNSYSIRAFNDGYLFNNNGTININDTSEGSTDSNGITTYNGKIIVGSAGLIENNGTLNIVTSNISSITQVKNLITNNGEMTIENGNMSASSGTTNLIENTGTLTIDNIYVNTYRVNTIIKNSGTGTINNGKFTVGEADNIVQNENTGTFTIKNGVYTLNTKPGYINYVLSNKGNAYIYGGTIDTSAYTYYGDYVSIVYNSENAEVTIDGLKVTTNPYVAIDNHGIANISNSTLVGIITNKKTMNLTNVTVNSNSYNGISNEQSGIMNINSGEYNVQITNNSTGSLNVGTKDGNVNTESPLISTNSTSITNTSGTLNFYDGTIKGTQAVLGSISEIEDGYEIIKETKENLEILHLGKEYVAQISSSNEKYYTLQEAIDNVENDNEVVKLLRNIFTLPTSSSVVVSADKNLIIDLNGFSINQNIDKYLINNGTLVLKDSSATKSEESEQITYNSKFITTKDIILENNGTLKIEGGIFTSTLSVKNLITNNGEMTIENGNMSASSGTTNLIENTGTLTIDNIYVNTYRVNTIIKNSGTGTINNGKFTVGEADNIVQNENTGTFTIKNGVYTLNTKPGYINYVLSNKGNAYIYGGTIDTSAYTYYGDYVSIVYNSENAEVTIDGLKVTTNPYVAIDNYGIANISNSILVGIITNKKTMNLTNVIVNSNSYNGINNEQSGIMNINSGEYNVSTTNSNNSTGSINIYGGTFNDVVTNSNTGTINIKKGTFTKGVTSTGNGIINIGIKGDTNDSGELNVSIENPNITGDTYGLTITNGKVNFYDGIISGTTDAVSGTINEIEDGYEIISGTTEDGKKSKYLSRLPVTEIESTGDTYYTLQEAIDAVTKSEETIKLLRRYTTLNTLETTTIPEDKNIVLDLNGYTLEQNNENFLVNNGTLKITDSSEEKNGKLAAYIDKLIENNNTLILENINISAERDITNVIVNNKTMRINNSNLSYNSDSIITSSNDPSTSFLINNGDIIIDGGSINGSYDKYNVEMIQNIGSLELKNVNFSLSNRNNNKYSENINGIKNTGVLKIDGGNYQVSRAGNYAPVLIRNANKLSISGAEFNISDNILLINTSKENIVIDSLSPTGTGTIISNYSESGELKLTNSNINGNVNNNGTGILTLENVTTSSSVSNNSKGILNINNVTFNSYYKPITTSQAGTTNINGATITNGYIENGNSHTININDINIVYNSTYRSGTITNYGIVNLISGTVTATVDNSITNTGTINIGTKDGNVSTEMPVITGKTYGVSNSDSGKVNFYDGIVSGESGAFYGTVNEVEPGYKIVTNKTDTLTSATLTLVGDDEKVAVLNGINFTSLQDAINSASDTNESIITLYKDVTFESNITVPANKNIKLYLNGYTLNKGSYDFTGEGKITVIDGTSTNALANIMESVKEVLNIEGIKKNIIIYEMDDGSAISSESTYKLYKDNEEVMLEEDAIGIYSVGNSNDEIRSANNKIYINELPKGKYKLIGDNNKEVKFEIDESGKVIGNVKENTKETRKLVSTAVAELIIMIQTGIEKVNYIMIILTLLVTISSLLYIVKKTNVKES